MAQLYNVDSPITREQRNNLNATFEDIQTRFSNLRYQISILAGGADLEAIIERILNAVTQAETVTSDTQAVLVEVNDALAQLTQLTNDANLATNRANDAATTGNTLNTELTSLQGELVTLRDSLQDILNSENQRVDNEQLRVENEEARNSTEQQRVDNESARVLAEQQRELDNEVIQQIVNNFESVDYDPTATYEFPTLVSFDGSTYIVLQTVTGVTPTDDKVNYRVAARKGIDGNGAVSTVNGRLPDLNGEVTLTSSDIGSTPLTSFDTLNTQSTEHFANNNIHKINISQFGAAFDGVTDDTASIQAAVDYLTALGGGDLYLPRGTAIITNTINVTKPITFIGEGDGSDTPNTNGELVSVSSFRWAGARDGVMFLVKSDTPNSYLFGGGFRNLLINGSSEAGIGIQGSSVGYMNFEKIKIREVTTHGIKLDADNGVLTQFNRISDYHFVYGANDQVRNANGLYLNDPDGGLVTQTHVLSITGLVQDGSLIYIGFSDNNIFEKIGGAVIGNGYNLYLANGDRVSANSNLVKYMGGRVYAESNTFGNRIMHYISEGGSIFVEEGAQLHYVLEDYQTSELYETHTFKMSDQLKVTVGELVPMLNASYGENALLWGSVNMPSSQNSKVLYSTPPISEWDNGVIESITAHFSSDTANTNSVFRSRVALNTVGPNGGTPTPKFDTFLNVPVNNSPYVNQSITIPTNVQYVRGDSVYLVLERVGVAIEDNTAGNVQLLGLTLNYRSNGPDSPGSGTYAVTKPYIDAPRL